MDVLTEFTELNFDRYQATLPYPRKKDYTVVYVTFRGELVGKWSNTEWYQLKEKPNGTTENAVDDDAYLAAMNAYRAEKNRLFEQFKADMFEYFGVTNNPKVGKAWEIANDRGDTIQDKFDEFEEIVELIQD